MKQEESKMQVELFNLIRARGKTCEKWFVIHSTPNGGHRTTTTAKKMKSEGVLAGVWDIKIPVQTEHYAGMFIEMKYGNNKLTEHQKLFREKTDKANAGFKPFKWVVCYSHWEAYKEIENYLKGGL